LHPRIATTSQGCYYYCWNPQGITAQASGEQLSQLLDAHLNNGMPMDDEYYMHLLNIQMDVYRLIGHQPLLPFRHIAHPMALSNIKQRIKAILQNKLGVNKICKISKTIYSISH
jgi:hypothetical protein